MDIVSIGNDWNRQGESSDQIIAAVDLEVAHVIEQSWEYAQNCKDQQLVDVLEHLVVRRGQGKVPGDRLYFDRAVEKLLAYIDDCNVNISYKNPWQALGRMLKIRGLLMDEGAPTDRMDNTIELLKERIPPFRQLTPVVRPIDSISQLGDFHASLEELPRPTSGDLEKRKHSMGRDSVALDEYYAKSNSDVWMQKDDYFLNPIRVAFLDAANGFALQGDQLLFKYLPDHKLFLFTKREEGYLPVVVEEFSASPDEIFRVTVDITESYVMLEIQEFHYKILIHTVASLLSPWLKRLRRLNPQVPMYSTRSVDDSINTIGVFGLILRLREDMAQHFDDILWED